MFEATNYSSIPNMNIKLYKDLFQELLEQYGRNYAVNSLFCALMDFSDEKDRIYNSKEPPVDFVSLQNVSMLTLTDVRKIASVRFTEALDQSYRSLREWQETTGADFSLLSKISGTVRKSLPLSIVDENDNSNFDVPESIRPLIFPVEQMNGIAEKLLHSTVNHMYFGQEFPTVLPKKFSAIVKYLHECSESDLNDFVKQGYVYRDHAIANYRASLKEGEFDYSEFGMFRPVQEIINERLNEMSDDADYDSSKYIFFNDIYGVDSFRLILRNLKSGRKGKTYIPNIENMMAWTILSQCDSLVNAKSLDYFVSNDYIHVKGGVVDNPGNIEPSQIYYSDSTGIHKILNEKILRIISFCVALPSELKQEYCSDIVNR